MFADGQFTEFHYYQVTARNYRILLEIQNTVSEAYCMAQCTLNEDCTAVKVTEQCTLLAYSCTQADIQTTDVYQNVSV